MQRRRTPALSRVVCVVCVCSPKKKRRNLRERPAKERLLSITSRQERRGETRAMCVCKSKPPPPPQNNPLPHPLPPPPVSVLCFFPPPPQPTPSYVVLILKKDKKKPVTFFILQYSHKDLCIDLSSFFFFFLPPPPQSWLPDKPLVSPPPRPTVLLSLPLSLSPILTRYPHTTPVHILMIDVNATTTSSSFPSSTREDLFVDPFSFHPPLPLPFTPPPPRSLHSPTLSSSSPTLLLVHNHIKRIHYPCPHQTCRSSKTNKQKYKQRATTQKKHNKKEQKKQQTNKQTNKQNTPDFACLSLCLLPYLTPPLPPTRSPRPLSPYRLSNAISEGAAPMCMCESPLIHGWWLQKRGCCERQGPRARQTAGGRGGGGQRRMAGVSPTSHTQPPHSTLSEVSSSFP